jgi:hypothetical protein
METITKIVAKLYIIGESMIKYILLFMGIMTIIWLFQLMRDPKKQFDLAMDLFKNIFVWSWKAILFLWLGILFLGTMLLRVVSVTFATVRDFFVSKN